MDELERVATETGFSGVVRVDRGGATVVERAFGLAHRPTGTPNTVDTRFAVASGTKLLTALTVLSLVEDGRLALDTTARSLLGADLPLVDDAVTVEHLLAHRSGIGDYLDEDGDVDLDAYLLDVPVHRLVTTEDYLAILDGFPPKFAPGSSFSYCNSGYVVLALLAERATGRPFATLVAERVCAPAGMVDTAFLRADELPARTATGYLAADGLRTNVLHLPVVGSGDGGIYTTVADVHALWGALLAGDVVPPPVVDRMRHHHSEAYGWGLWLRPGSDVAWFEGADAGVSFRSVHDPATATIATVVSNTTSGAWPLARLLDP